MRKLLFIFFLSIIALRLHAQGIVVVNENTSDKQTINLSGNLFYLIDSLDAFSFNQILRPDFENRFTQSASSTFLYKKNNYSQWYKLSVLNNSAVEQHLVLSINNPLINNITFFSQNDSSYYHTGLNHNYHQRAVNFKNYLFNITLAPGEQALYSFKISGQLFPTYIPITLSSKAFVEKQLTRYAFLQGAFYCMVILLVILLLLLWLTEKNKSYLFLLFILVYLTLFILWRNGLLFQYVFPNAPHYYPFIRKTLFALGLFLIAVFQWYYFNIAKSKPLLRKAFRIYFIATIAYVLFQHIIPNYEFYQYGIYVVTISLVLISLLNIRQALKNKKPLIKPIILMVLVLLADAVLQLFFKFSIKGFTFIDIQLTSFTAVFMFGTIFWIFILKFRSFRTELVEMKKNLEHLVEKRTFQINSQKDELKSQHEELLLQKETLQSQREELRAQKELLEIKNLELAKLSLVASKTDNLIYIFNPDGELDWFNSSYSHTLGITYDDYKQRDERLNILEISTNNNIRHVLNTCLRQKIVVSYETKMVDENNNEKWYQTTLTPILDQRENVKHLIAIDTDITKLKQYEDELEQQQKDAEHQKNLAVNRKEELEERQIEIYDSIRYAKRIQTAIMPKVKQIQRDFYDSFVLFLPKDIVSGDFYWYHRINNKYFIAAVDCTGHGVPGAFMSIIGTYLLNSIIIHNGITDPAEILRQLNRKIKIALKTDNHSQTSDGMDLALVVIDKTEKTLEFSSALRPMYLFNGGNFIEVKGDKTPITSSISGTSIASFTNHRYSFNEGDLFYIFSDGIIDQFGGKVGKKFLTKRFKQLLFEINPLSMKEQKDIIKRAFDEWKGEYEQVDDVLVMGVRFNEPMNF
jgi:PAS domain S-box-containing protein